MKGNRIALTVLFVAAGAAFVLWSTRPTTSNAKSSAQDTPTDGAAATHTNSSTNPGTGAPVPPRASDTSGLAIEAGAIGADIDREPVPVDAPITAPGETLELLGKGRIVDQDGAPMSKATLRVQRVKSVLEGRAAVEDAPRIQVHLGADASFELRGPAEKRALWLSASASGYVTAEPVEFAPPRSDLKVVMLRASRIVGRVLVDPGVAPGHLLVVATRREPLPAEIGALDGVITTRVGEDGTFELADIRPGQVDVLFQENRGGTATFTVEGVRLVPGEDAKDTRIQLVDLRGRVPAPERPR